MCQYDDLCSAFISCRLHVCIGFPTTLGLSSTVILLQKWPKLYLNGSKVPNQDYPVTVEVSYLDVLVHPKQCFFSYITSIFVSWQLRTKLGCMRVVCEFRVSGTAEHRSTCIEQVSSVSTTMFDVHHSSFSSCH